MPEESIITGTVELNRARPSGVRVQAYDRDLPSLERQQHGGAGTWLGEATVDDNGEFQIVYAAVQVGDDEAELVHSRDRAGRADLTFRLLARDGRALALRRVETLDREFGPDDVIFNVPSRLSVRLFGEAGLSTIETGDGDTEVEVLQARIAPVLASVSLAEATDRDIEFLTAELGLRDDRETRDKVNWLWRCARLANAAAGVPTEAFYGWGRLDVPLGFSDLVALPLTRLAEVLERIADTDDDSLVQTLDRAVEERIVPPWLRGHAADYARLLRNSLRQRRDVTLRLVDESHGTPLVGYGVSFEGGYAVTETSGDFPLTVATTRTTVQLTVFAPGDDTDTIAEVGVDIPPDWPPERTLEVGVAVSPTYGPSALLHIGHPSGQLRELVDTLQDLDITTFAEVRRRAGITGLAELHDQDPALLKRIDAHADLDRLSVAVPLAGKLIDAGFPSVLAIARTQRSRFSYATTELVDGFSVDDAIALHTKAKAQADYLSNVYAGLAGGIANGLDPLVIGPTSLLDGLDGADGEPVLHTRCDCAECQSALSPAAYLVDLLNYTVEHVHLFGGMPVDVDYLTEAFKQPFGELPTDCSAVEGSVRQIRLCVEVLRAYLGPRPLADGARETALSAAEHAYRFTAYQGLLQQIGTSYDEIRRIRTASADRRQALAARLGIRLIADEFDQLLLDTSLREANLERLFGLSATDRDLLSGGLVFGDDLAQIARWRLDGVRWGEHTDDAGLIYVTLSNPFLFEFRVDLYADPERTRTVASGRATAPVSTVSVHGADGVSGEISIADTTDSATISLCAVPTLLAWQLDAARAQWRHQDWLDEGGPLPGGPIVDPDLIGPDDLRSPAPGTAGVASAYDLWLARRKWVDAQLQAVAADRVANGLPTVLQTCLATPINQLDTLATTFDSGDSAAIAAAQAAVTAKGLRVDAFLRLMAIRGIDALAVADSRNRAVTDDEWDEAYSILVSAAKSAKLATWRTEEHNAGLRLGPKDFWPPLCEPVYGSWPPKASADHPMIDPQVVAEADLAESTIGHQAHTWWRQRMDVLAKLPNLLRDARVSGGWQGLIRFALGHPGSGDPLEIDLETLAARLAGIDEAQKAAATNHIQSKLHLDLNDFARLVAIGRKSASPDPAARPTTAEWDQAATILAPAHKVVHLYPQWRQQEQTAALAYWAVFKARLPRWLTTAEQRAAWSDFLKAQTYSPAIDPDVVRADDLRRIDPADAAYALWQQRFTALTKRRAALAATREAAANPLAGLNQIINDTVGITPAQLDQLLADRAGGASIQGRLTQLSLSAPEFEELVRVRELAGAGQPILPTEWDGVYALLASIENRRRTTEFRSQERDRGVIVSDDWFTATNTPPSSAARRVWQSKLNSRTDQRSALTHALTDAASTVEGAALPILRDALTEATSIIAGAVGTAPQDRKRWLTKRLLIDTETSACATTTRVGQAIETLQTLLFTLHTGESSDAPVPLRLDAEQFDEEWQWLGSYPTWRSAMLMFLHPDLLLYPRLRRPQSPGFQEYIAQTDVSDLDPYSACAAACAYTDYFRDVTRLKIHASCQIYARPPGDPCNDDDISSRNLFFMFAVSAYGRAYWATYDPADHSGYAQSPWRRLPPLSGSYVSRIIGAMPWAGTVYIFCIVVDSNGQRLQLVRFDVTYGSGWDTAPTDLPTPTQLVELEIVPVQTASNSEPPGLAFHSRWDPARNYGMYYRTLATDGVQWTSPDVGWDNFWYPLDWLKWSLEAVLVVRGDTWVVRTSNVTNQIDVELVRLRAGTKAGVSRAVDLGPGIFLGAVPGQEAEDVGVIFPHGTVSRSEIYVFYRPAGSSTVRYRRFTSEFGGELGSKEQITISDMVSVVPSSGSGPWDVLAYQLSRRRNAYYYHRYTRDGERLVGSTMFRAVLRLSTNTDIDIPHRLTPFEAQLHRTASMNAFLVNNDTPPSVHDALKEALYLVPMHAALQLQAAGHYEAAIDWLRTCYDDRAPGATRNIYYGLRIDSELSPDAQFHRTSDWLGDPLNPHRIAATRPYSYTRFTITTLIRILLDYADTEFTSDTPESLARARVLYLKALDLLDVPALHRNPTPCDDVIGSLVVELGDTPDPVVPAFVGSLYEQLTDGPLKLLGLDKIKKLVDAVVTTFSAAGALDNKLVAAKALVNEARLSVTPGVSAGDALKAHSLQMDAIHRHLIADLAYDVNVQAVADHLGPTLILLPIPPRFPVLNFCVPASPALAELRRRAELNLAKLQNCRNIAGMKRDMPPYAEAIDLGAGIPSQITLPLSGPLSGSIQPTLYRYQTLIDRAKQYVQLAGQAEDAMLAALEQGEDAAYDLLRANQELTLSNAGVRLQDLRIKEAGDSVDLAALQQDRAQLSVDRFTRLIAGGVSDYEFAAMFNLEVAADLLRDAGQETLQGASFGLSGIFPSVGASFSETASTGFQAGFLSTSAQAEQLQASYERREEEWAYQEALARQDVAIGAQQVTLAHDEVDIRMQEKSIAELQVSGARDALHFLQNRFTNAELYQWLYRIRSDVYRYFLSQATSLAQLARTQLAFERQVTPPAFIQADYWRTPQSDAPSGTAVDRRGLTGSARLLRDISQLDQYAFETDKRKLQLTRTISLATLVPVEFQQFREIGVLSFATPMELFDRDFPGHYLRLITRIRATVVALIPPSRGIRATLLSSGLSRVVVGPDVFQQIAIRREPDSVALTKADSIAGVLYELTPTQTDGKLLPFEGSGVDTSWEFRLPKASNSFDFNSIADVLLTVDYSALDSPVYRPQVIAALDTQSSAEQPFSFRNQLSDAWYDLHNPDQTASPMTVRFTIRRQDFPVNIEDLSIAHLALYFSRNLSSADGSGFEVTVSGLRHRAPGSGGFVGGGAVTTSGLVSTRKGNGAGWSALIGKSPVGDWELALPNTTETRHWFTSGAIRDLLFVITWSGRVPDWPADT